MQKIIFLIIFNYIFIYCSLAQPLFNANTHVPVYNESFKYGTNMSFYKGYNNNLPSDILIADLVSRAGLGTMRLALYDDFLTRYGAEIRQSEFDYYDQLQLFDLTLFLNDPHPTHQETDSITCVHKTNNKVERFRNQVFRNLYLPIWDKGENGTPINDLNYYAAYVYAVVKDYGNHIKFYEVWNEPDFAANNNCTLASGIEGNWLDNNPAPCDLVNLRTEITAYIRMLRITYEIVKTYYPESYVATGGIGYPNFLDAILRNTDNPDQGKVTAEYPLKGGAWFDVLSFHSYPQYSLRYWNSTLKKFIYNRHSDKAVAAVFNLRDQMRTVLYKYKYEGVTYPEKPFLLTEFNIPRKSYSNYDFIGSDEAQKNTMLKTMILAQKEKIMQVYAYTIGDTQDEDLSIENQQGMDLMGFYYNLNRATPSTAKLTSSGIAIKGLASFLKDYQVDYSVSEQLNLTKAIDGVAFRKNNDVRIVLWSKTQVDSSEYSTSTYSFPLSMGFDSIKVKQWNFIQTNDSVIIKGRSVKLTGSPVYFQLLGNVNVGVQAVQSIDFKVYPNPFKNEVLVSSNHTGSYKLIVYNMQGDSLQSFTGKGAISNKIISLKNAPPGMYIFVLHTQNMIFSNKLIMK